MRGDEISDWSFLDARITETIATTEGPEGDFNAAPMGVIRNLDEPKKAYTRLWEGSQTFENVRNTKEVTVNFTRNPIIYVKGALYEIEQEYIDPNCRLSEGERDGWVRCTVEFVKEEKDGKVKRWELIPREGEVEEKTLYTISRGFNSVIEATVHATRVEFKPDLAERIEHHLEIARKCGGEREYEAAEMIENYIEGLG